MASNAKVNKRRRDVIASTRIIPALTSQQKSLSAQQTFLVDRLIDYLGNCISVSERKDTSGCLTLPASAVSWLGQQQHLLYPRDTCCPTTTPPTTPFVPPASVLGRDYDSGDEFIDDAICDGNNKWSLLQALLPHATHLRISTDPWPSFSSAAAPAAAHSPTSLARTHHHHQTTASNNTHIIDLRVFPNLQVLWLDGVPVEWLSRLNNNNNTLHEIAVVSRTLKVLRLEHQSRIHSVSDLLDFFSHHAENHRQRSSAISTTRIKAEEEGDLTTTAFNAYAMTTLQQEMEEEEDATSMTTTTKVDPLMMTTLLSEDGATVGSVADPLAAPPPLSPETLMTKISTCNSPPQGSLFPALTHLKLSHCTFGEEQSGLQGRSRSGLQGRRRIRQQREGGGATLGAPPPPSLSILSRNLQSICLSHNKIQTEDSALAGGLHMLSALSKLDLSHNLLSDAGLPHAHMKLGNIAVLDLSHNRLTGVRGIDRLLSLQVLRLDFNALVDLHDTASRLANLPLLTELHLQGNPLQYRSSVSTATAAAAAAGESSRVDRFISHVEKDLGLGGKRKMIYSSYRVDVLNAFRERRFADYDSDELRGMSMQYVRDNVLPVLDGVETTARELHALQARTFVPVDMMMAQAAVAAAARQSIGNNNNGNDGVLVPLEENTSRNALLIPESALRFKSVTPTIPFNYYPSACRRGFSGKSRNGSGLNKRTRSLRHAPILDVDDYGPIHIPASKNGSMATVSFTVAEVVGSLPSLDREGAGAVVTTSAKLNDMDDGRSAWDILLSMTDESERFNLEENIGQKYLASITNTVSLTPLESKPQERSDDSKSRSTANVTLPITNGDANISPLQPEVATTPVFPQPGETSDVLPADPKTDQVTAKDELSSLSLSIIVKVEEEEGPTDLKASAATTETADEESTTLVEISSSLPHDPIAPSARVVTQISNGTPPVKVFANRTSSMVTKSSGETSSQASTLSPTSPSPNKLSLRVSSFSENHWQDDNISVPSLFGAAQRQAPLSKKEAFRFAEKNSTYDGPKTYGKLLIREYVELYFRLFVFAASTMPDESSSGGCLMEGEGAWQEILQQYPRIQMWSVDMVNRDEFSQRKTPGHFTVGRSPREAFRRVWREKIVACGKAALRRLTPSRVARFGFHGELLWSAAESSHMKPEVVVECRETICCFSETSFYIIVDHDAVTNKSKDQKKNFPLPIPERACFKDAKWPHALACHAFESLKGITIGFGFQRLTLHFADPSSAEGFTYILLTSNKLETVALLKEIQELSSAVNETMFGSPRPGASVQIENDDPRVLDALGAAVAPDPFGVVLHYQILQQRWKSGGRGTVRRVCVVTDTKLFLLDEDYVGDGSESMEGGRGRVIGESMNRLVDSADLNQIVQVQAADADPKAITIVIKPSKLKRSHNWRLLCRDGQGAEKLVEDVRKAISLGGM